jgi:Ran GTPase-activating protein (RanGAP) involved in mRNA processing and transport
LLFKLIEVVSLGTNEWVHTFVTSFSCAQIDLRNNQLCGVNEYCGYDTYTTEGIQAIASAISVSVSLTSINLERNQIRSKGAEHIAKGISVSASLTSVNLLGNTFDDETVLMLLETKKEKPSLLTLCGLDRDATAADFRRKRLDSRDAKLLAPEIAVSASLTSIDLSDNHLNDKAAKHIAKAISVSASLTSIDLSDNYRIRADGERAITEAMYVSASLTSINLS